MLLSVLGRSNNSSAMAWVLGSRACVNLTRIRAQVHRLQAEYHKFTRAFFHFLATTFLPWNPPTLGFHEEPPLYVTISFERLIKNKYTLNMLFTYRDLKVTVARMRALCRWSHYITYDWFRYMCGRLYRTQIDAEPWVSI